MVDQRYLKEQKQAEMQQKAGNYQVTTNLLAYYVEQLHRNTK